MHLTAKPYLTSSAEVDPLAAALAWLQEGRPCALATVIETWGSAAAPVGSMMAVVAEDAFQGSVSGGCVEAEAVATALEVIETGAPQTIAFGVDDQTAWGAGLACGGTVRIVVAALEPVRDADLLADILSARSERQPRVLATRLADGARRLYRPDSRNPSAVTQALTSGESRIAALDEGETFLQAVTPPPRLVIVGATHIAQILKQAARAIGYDIAIVDPRRAFTSASRFDAAEVAAAWPDESLAALLDDPFSALVTLTHADHIDDEALAIALKSRCRYVGALGARKTHQKRAARLAAMGFTEARHRAHPCARRPRHRRERRGRNRDLHSKSGHRRF